MIDGEINSIEKLVIVMSLLWKYFIQSVFYWRCHWSIYNASPSVSGVSNVATSGSLLEDTSGGTSVNRVQL